MELKPQVDDGKHFVIYNSRRQDRIEIDPEMLNTLGLKIVRPPSATPEAETVHYTFKARIFDPAAKEITLTLKNDFPSGEMQLTVPVEGKTDDRSAFTEWAEYRAYHWGMDDSRLAEMWDRQVKSVYGLEEFEPSEIFPPNNRGRTASLMNVLGGDAAIRETLQMQNLIQDRAPDTDGKLIPVDQVKGVTVRAHEYEELLDGKPGGKMALADLCPPDRLFAWFPNPEGVLQLLDGSGNVLGRFGSSRSKLILDQQIMQKHMAKLGLTEPQLRLILQSGFVGETAVLLPDLFLSEGTDVTTLTRINNMQALQPVLKGMGLNSDQKIRSFMTPSGIEAYMCVVQNDILIFSSNGREIDHVLQTMQGIVPGLGQSAEFRYMLTQLGPADDTAAYVYLSDPFIRRLTGPALKIAQMRRLQAKARMESLSAGDLLYRLDHRKPAAELQTLLDGGYISAGNLDGITWKDGVATDPVWGSAARLSTLTNRLPLEVTQREKAAYDRYRDQYERFWRQFFDPIAVRVDLKPEQEVETMVFILPLINSSIYDAVREFFPADQELPPGNRPVITPAPIAQMSLNLAEERWIDLLEGISQMVEHQLGMQLPIWEQIGPGIHFGLADSDSIITFGSGELMNLFSSGSEMRNNEMFMIPMIGSLFTRPVVIALDLQDPDATREALRGMPTGNMMEDSGFLELQVNLVQITGQDKWLIRVRLGDMLFITLSMEVQEDYLVFSNLPLTYHPEVSGSEPLLLRDATMLLQPGAIEKTGPGFATSALDIAREQAMAGLGVLNLYYMAGFTSLEEALDTSRRLFGYVPVHPSPGEFNWTDSGPVSTVFGSLYTGKQPPLEELDIPGLLPKTEKAEVSMQLENDGLRTRLLWKGKKTE